MFYYYSGLSAGLEMGVDIIIKQLYSIGSALFLKSYSTTIMFYYSFLFPTRIIKLTLTLFSLRVVTFESYYMGDIL